MKNRRVSLKFINSRNAFIVSILVIFVTIVSVWLFGLGQDRTLIQNSYLSTGFIAINFFAFISISLYKGAKLKDTLGDITDRFDIEKVGEFASSASSSVDGVSIGSDDIISGLILSILLWIVATILAFILTWIFGAIIWFAILLFAAMLYWVFFRALKLVFKNSKSCRGTLGRSIYLGASYTTLYTSWIFGLIYILDLVIK